MIPVVTQTLANFLAQGMALIGTENIGFEHPSYQLDCYPSVNLYLYDLYPTKSLTYRKQARIWQTQVNKNSSKEKERFPLGQNVWFDASFLLTVQDHTAMGKQHLISKALSHLLQHQHFPAHTLPAALQGYGAIPLMVTAVKQPDSFWEALGIPLQPALKVTVTVPFSVVQESMSLGA